MWGALPDPFMPGGPRAEEGLPATWVCMLCGRGG